MLSLTWKAKKIAVRINYSDGVVRVSLADVFTDGTTKNEGLLDRRSTGFKRHFSFFVNFRAGVQQNTFKDAILLLDEPGLNLHPEKQGALVDVIRDLAQTNQVLYTTHSPFMIFTTSSAATY
jgi:predicted ATPase